MSLRRAVARGHRPTSGRAYATAPGYRAPVAPPRPPVEIPPRVRVLAAFVGTAALCLCVWQGVRHVERNEGREAALRVEGLPVLTEPVAPAPEHAWRVVRWSGRWDGAPELIAGRQHKGRRGYGVAQRFVRGDGVALLVDRGWLDADGLAGELEVLAGQGASGAEAVLVGLLVPTFGNPDASPSAGHGTRIWPAKAWPALMAVTRTDQTLYVASGAEDGSASANSHAVDGFAQVPARDDTSLHYASQWFALAILASIAAIPRAATRIRDFLSA